MSILLEHFSLLLKGSGIIRGKVFKRSRLCEALIRSYFEKTDPTEGIPHMFGNGGLNSSLIAFSHSNLSSDAITSLLFTGSLFIVANNAYFNSSYSNQMFDNPSSI